MALHNTSDEEYLKFLLQEPDIADCIGMFEVTPLDDRKDYFSSEGRSFLALRKTPEGPDHDLRYGSHYFFGPPPTMATTMYIPEKSLQCILETEVPRTVVEDIGGFQIISFLGINYGETDTDI